jgi:glycosyltransferase involved in cell wall biosynthesis
MTEPLITIIVPVYAQPKMLEKQLQTWASYSPETLRAFRFIVVDDCSPEPVESLVSVWCAQGRLPVSLYRIDKDVAWNRGMARNLGTKRADTPFILHVDTDHILTAGNAANLLTTVRSFVGAVPKWFRFARRRIGAADETRKKDKADPEATDVRIHPHIDSYLTTPAAFWKAGGYNTRFSGVLGGGTPFLKEMERVNGEPGLLEGTELHVHTRRSVPDSSEHTLPRDPEAFKRRKREIMAKYGTLRADPKEALPLPWHRVL